MAAATATMLVGGDTIEQRRFLRLADEARKRAPDRADAYVETAARLVRAVTIDAGVAQAVLDGKRAVALAAAAAEEILTAALAAYARALFFAGDLDEAAAVATRALEHPAIERHVPSLGDRAAPLSRSSKSNVANISFARGHAERARGAVGKIGSSRSWLGANASAALGSVLSSRRKPLLDAEHELVVCGALLPGRGGDPASHVAPLALLSRVRLRRGRLAEAETALRSVREALGDLVDSGRVAALTDEVQQELETAKGRASSGEVLERPSDAELAVLRLLGTDLTTREIGERLFVSANTIRSHKRSLYHKLDVHTRADAIARAGVLGLLDHSQSPG